jgi:rhodanese-related sulfurtransferase
MWQYLEANALAESLKKNPNSVLVIDVREDDFEGGNIVGALNHPAGYFSHLTAQAILEVWQEGQEVVFHCMKSQVRGPTCASFFDDYVASKTDVTLSVRVLQYGFEYFVAKYGRDPTLVENYQANVRIPMIYVR